MSSAITTECIYSGIWPHQSPVYTNAITLEGRCARGQSWSYRAPLCAWVAVVPVDEVSNGLIVGDTDAADVQARNCIHLYQQPALCPLVDGEGQVLLRSSNTILSSSILWLGINLVSGLVRIKVASTLITLV